MQPYRFEPYCGQPPLAADWFHLNLDPVLLLSLGLFGLALFITTRGRIRSAAVIGILILTYVSPLCARSSALFSVRTIHEVLVTLAAAPLLASLSPPTSRALPPVASLALFFGATALWYIPRFYGFALTNSENYWSMELLLIASSTLFWHDVLSRDAGTSLVLAVAAMFAMTGLGSFLTLVGHPLYAPHLTTTQSFGLSALEDQQLAGLVMWVPGTLPFLGVILWRFHRVMARTERQKRRGFALIGCSARSHGDRA